MTETATNPRKVRTPPFRMSFPALLKPRKQEGDDGKEKENYQLTMLFPPGSDLKGLEAALKASLVEKFGDDTTKWPKLKRGKKEVLADFKEYNDGRDKSLPGEWAGWTMVRANAPADRTPGVVGPIKGADGKFPVVKDNREVYGGRWARATVEAFFYDNKKGGRGLSFGLVNVQLLKHDAPFGAGHAKAEEDFDDASSEWAGGDDPSWGETASKPKAPNWDDEIPF